MLNQRYAHNDHIALTAPKDLAGGQPVKIGQYVGVSLKNVKQGETATIWLKGSYDFEVTGALTEGQMVYIKADGTLTATAAGNFPFGISNSTKAAATAGIAEVAPLGLLQSTAAAA